MKPATLQGMKEITIYTDGGCLGNPGPGGWAYIILKDSDKMEASGGEKTTTNNRMELTAVIQALRDAAASGIPCRITLHTDSKYVKNGITEWIKRWVINGWKTAAKKPVKNKDLWIVLHELAQALDVEWKWVKGHSGDMYNELCDGLVKSEMDRISAK